MFMKNESFLFVSLALLLNELNCKKHDVQCLTKLLKVMWSFRKLFWMDVVLWNSVCFNDIIIIFILFMRTLNWLVIYYVLYPNFLLLIQLHCCSCSSRVLVWTGHMQNTSMPMFGQFRLCRTRYTFLSLLHIQNEISHIHTQNSLSQ